MRDVAYVRGVSLDPSEANLNKIKVSARSKATRKAKWSRLDADIVDALIEQIRELRNQQAA